MGERLHLPHNAAGLFPCLYSAVVGAVDNKAGGRTCDTADIIADVNVAYIMGVLT